MTTRFWVTRPPPFPASRNGAQFSVAAAAGVGSGLPVNSRLLTPGAGLGTVQGVVPGIGIGQSFGPGAGLITAITAPVNTTFGVPNHFGPGAGLIAAFGYAAVIGTTVAVIPPPAISAFAPSLSELGIDIWERVGKQANELTVTHLTSMRRSMNLLLARWSNRGIALWRVASATLTLQPGVATYALPATTIEMLDTAVTVAGNDRMITPISRATYAALPNKLASGVPTIFWFDRLVTPSVTIWPVPDASATYVLSYYAFAQVQDADPAMGTTANIPYRFLEAYAAGVAALLAQKWCDPQRAIALDGYAKECFAEAAAEDREIVTSTLAPDFAAYLE